MRRLATAIRQLLGRHSNIRRRPQSRPTFRLELETLESRVTPTGNASGAVLGVAFLDSNANGVFDAGESALPGASTALVGTTTQGDAVRIAATSDDNGVYEILNVLPGTYHLEKDSRFYLASAGSSSDTFSVSGGQTLTRNSAYLGLSPTLISMRQFLNTSTGDGLFNVPGEGEALANFRENNLPFLANDPGVLTLAKNSSAVFDLSGFFSDPDFTNSLIRFDTSFGDINVELLDTEAPQTVANFFNYITSDRFDNAIFHRLDDDFVLQGGGFTFDADDPSLDPVSKDAPVENEFGRSNLFGTIAMAKLPGDPNSATNEFFFNLGDNSENLDEQNGGFTVFGEIVGQSDGDVLNDINNTPVRNFGSPFDEIPLVNYFGNNFPSDTNAGNYVFVNDVEIVKRDEFLTYTLVSNSNPNVVSARVEQNRLFVDTVEDAVGESQITIRATDRFGASVESTFKVVVENQPPTATVALNDDQPLETDTLTATATTADPNGDPVSLTYTWKVNGAVVQTSALTTALTDTLDLTGVASPGDTVTVEVVPFDDVGLAGDTVTAEATVNQPPATTGIANESFDGPGEFTLDVSGDFSDPDGDDISFSATLDDSSPLPSWLQVDADGMFSGNPAVGDAAVLSIEVTATDIHGASTSSTFDLTVSNTPTSLNDDPEATIVSFAPDSPTGMDTMTVTVTTADADNDAVVLTYVWNVNGGTVQTTASTASLTDTLDLSTLTIAPGDEVSVEVTPDDGTTTGTTQSDITTVV